MFCRLGKFWFKIIEAVVIFFKKQKDEEPNWFLVLEYGLVSINPAKSKRLFYCIRSQALHSLHEI